MEWSTWIQEIGKAAVEVYGAKEQRDYEVQKLQLQQETAAAQAAAERMRLLGTSGGGLAGVSPTVLIVGAVALVGLLFVAGKD